MIQTVLLFVLNYAVAKLTAPDGPKLSDNENPKGNFGAPMPRVYGGAVRIDNTEFIAFGPLVEKKNKVKKNWLDKTMNILAPFTNLLPQPHYYTYSRSIAILLADRTNDDPIEDLLKLYMNGKLVFNSAVAVGSPVETFDAQGRLIKRKWTKANKTHSAFDEITIYGGGFDQTADPTISGYEDDVQGFRGTAYASIKKLQLADFGNSTPQCDALIQAKQGESLATIAAAVCRAAGMDPEHNVSTSQIASKAVRGYGVLQESSCWEALRPLLPAHRVDAAEVSGQLRFFQRGKAMKYVIPAEHMAGHVFGDERPELWRSTRSPDIGLPKEYSFTFRDPARDYQSNTQTSRRSEGDASSNISASVAITLTANEGRQTAELLHWEPWAARLGRSFTLTDQWIGVQPGDVCGLPSPDGIRPHRIVRKSRGANGIIEVETVCDEGVVYRSSAIGGSGTIPDNPVDVSAATRLVLIDGPILADLQDDEGFYFAIAGESSSWRGAAVERSEGGPYEELVSTIVEAVIGDVIGTLAAGSTTGLDDTLDNTSVLTVVLLRDDMVLETAEAGEIDLLGNAAWVGDSFGGEVIQFTTATQIDEATWELTGLLRGRKGTDYAITTHGSGETFVLLEPDSLIRVNFGEPDWNLSRDYRAISELEEDADADIIPFTNTGEGKRPYSPVNVAGSFDGGNNLSLTWDRRSRLNSGLLGEATEEYEVDILDGVTVVRTISVTAESASYSAADQVTDGFVAGQTVVGNIYQISAVRGRGHPRSFSVSGPLAFTVDSTLITADTTALTADTG